MNDELNIPVLDDLVSKGQTDDEVDNHQLSFDENSALEIEQDQPASVGDETPVVEAAQTTDELSADASLQELLIDEEIRMILDKHMDNAYEEIIRLLNHKIS